MDKASHLFQTFLALGENKHDSSKYCCGFLKNNILDIVLENKTKHDVIDPADS